MLSENFDKKIKDSFEGRTADFNETSWQKMEKLLDKHLPQKKDDRRRLLWLFFFLLIGGGTTLYLTGIFSPKENKIASTQAFNSDKSVKENNSTLNIDPVKTKPDQNQEKEEIVLNKEKTLVPENKSTQPDEKSSINLSSKISTVSEKKQSTQKLKITQPQKVSKGKNEKSVPTGHVLTQIDQANKQQVTNLVVASTDPKNQNQEAEKQTQELKTEQKEINKPETNPLPEKIDESSIPEILTGSRGKKANPENKKSFLKNFVISVTAGPDMSAVGLNNTGRVKLAYGAGLGYRISNHFSIRSGFYVGRKIYTAAPEDYNPPANFWTYYPNLKYVDANCKVYEVPVNLDYNFGITKKQNWFVSVGISSLFMKKEEYSYYFKPNNSPQYIYYSRSYENKNKHYFSILNLSGGFAKKISPALSIQAEPFAKIALTGVGYGKMKLNSAGVLFTAAIQPFNTQTKKEKK